MTTTPTIRDLPDYPAVKKLASALHRLDASHHGAAIMIGAGFSRSAARHVGGQKKMRLWNEFTRSLARELTANEQDLSFADPLRVAEEYRAYFGQAALNDRIRFEIENEAWRTGPLYLSLLKLPWSEVLTTNWDTLLERAATEIHSPYYTPVTKTSDLAWAQSPRIVKLHGTIGVTDSFIAAQEDYRTYPERFAPFVNLARQVFIENELCLLGFSGDDPNFLQWAGWVRDHLANHARKIYLVGALNLSAARRKQLESINVAPVDLWPAVAHITDADLLHQRATELFLQAMRDEETSQAKPHKWQPTSLTSPSVNLEDHTRAFSDPAYGASLLAGQLKTLRQDRESYPGWLVCPPSLRWRLSAQLTSPFPNQKNLAALAPVDRASLLYEIAWRHSITFEYISPWLSDALLEVAKFDQPCAISKRQQMEIAVALLNNTRWLQADSVAEQQVIDERVGVLIGILEKDAPYLPDCAAEVAYYRALTARDRLDYDGLTIAVKGIAGEDPVWKLRNAALLMELGRSEEATQLVAQAYGDLREDHRRDRQSIPILSRLLWAHWLLEAAQQGNLSQTTEALPAFAEGNYREWECDPWSWLDTLRRNIDKHRDEYLERRNPIEPQFEQGHYRDHSNDLHISNEISDFLPLDGLSRTVGIPLLSGGGVIDVNLLARHAEKIVISGGAHIELWNRTLAIRSASSESSVAIKSLFSRIGIASTSQDVIDTLVPRVLSAVKYWQLELNRGTRDRQRNALSRLRVFLEVLARLAVRVSAAQAKNLFLLAVSLGQQSEMQHIWLSEVLDDLLTYSLKSIPETEQGGLLSSALAFPLQSEVVCRDFPRWPNPVIEHPHARDAYPAIGVRIGQLIAAVETSNGQSRSAPLCRLLPLVAKDGFLTQTERERLAGAVWGDCHERQILPETGLLPHALLLLPEIDVGRADALVRAHLYEHGADILEDTQKELRSYLSPEIQRAILFYEGIANAAANEITHMFPAPEQALTLFDDLVMWRPPASREGPFQFDGGSRKKLAESIGRALAYSIVPALADDAKTFSRLEQLEAFYFEVDGAQTVLPAFVYFSRVNEGASKFIAKIIQAALRSRDSAKVSYSAIALQKWMELPGSELSKEFKSLSSMVIAIIESGRTIGLQQLIWLARSLIKEGQLPEEQRNILLEIAPTVFDATDYNNIDPSSPEAVSASTIRAECVRLAQLLRQQFPEDQKLKELIVRSQADPLPEVRFALNSTK